MSAEIRSEAPEIHPALVRTAHDPSQPASDTGDAAKALGMSRQAILAGIKRGSIPGYAILGKSRARWYVYDHFLNDTSGENQTVELARVRAQLVVVENELALERSRSEHRRIGRKLFSEAVELMAEANRRLVEAYRDLEDAEDADAQARVGRWVPDRMDGGD